MVEHLQGPISLMESSITDSSLGLMEELCKERGDCLNSAENGGILGMRVGGGWDLITPVPFPATSHSTFIQQGIMEQQLQPR